MNKDCYCCSSNGQHVQGCPILDFPLFEDGETEESMQLLQETLCKCIACDSENGHKLG